MSANAISPPAQQHTPLFGLCGPSELSGELRNPLHHDDAKVTPAAVVAGDGAVVNSQSVSELDCQLSQILLPEADVILQALRSKGLSRVLILNKVFCFLPKKLGSPNVDLFLSTWEEFYDQPGELEALLDDAWKEHPDRCLKLIFYKGTQLQRGTRHVFYNALMWLWKVHPASLLANLASVPQYGTWKDLCEVLARACEGPENSLARDEAVIAKRRMQTRKLVRLQPFGTPHFKLHDRLSLARHALQRYDEDLMYHKLFELTASLFARQMRQDLDNGPRDRPSECALACPSLDKSVDRRTLICEGIARHLFPELGNDDERLYAYTVRERFRKEVLKTLRTPSKMTLANAKLPCGVQDGVDINQWHVPEHDKLGQFRNLAAPSVTSSFCRSRNDIVAAKFVASMLRKTFGPCGLAHTLVAQDAFTQHTLFASPCKLNPVAGLPCRSVACAFAMLAAESSGATHRRCFKFDSRRNAWSMKYLGSHITSNYSVALACRPKFSNASRQHARMKGMLQLCLNTRYVSPDSIRRLLFITERVVNLEGQLSQVLQEVQEAKELFAEAKVRFPEVVLWSLVGPSQLLRLGQGDLFFLSGFSSNILNVLMGPACMTLEICLPMEMAKSLSTVDILPVAEVPQPTLAWTRREDQKDRKHAQRSQVILHPNDILFTRAHVKPICPRRHLGNIRELATNLLINGTDWICYDQRVREMPMHVCRHDGKWYTLDNRRLAAYRLYFMHSSRSEALTCELMVPSKWEWNEKFTAGCLGRTVEVRQGARCFGTIGMSLEETTFEIRSPPRQRCVVATAPGPFRSPAPPIPPFQHIGQVTSQAVPATGTALVVDGHLAAAEEETATQIAFEETQLVNDDVWVSAVQPIQHIGQVMSQAVPATDTNVVVGVYVGGADEEPAARITPEEAQVVSDELWASSIQRLAQGLGQQASSSRSARDLTENQSRLVLLTFSRHPKELHGVLLSSELAQSLAREGVDIVPPWSDGSLVLARGVDGAAVAEATMKWHVAVWEADQSLVLDALRQIPYNRRPRLKPGGENSLPRDISLFGDVSDEPSQSASDDFGAVSSASSDVDLLVAAEHGMIRVSCQRTFIHVQFASSSPRTSRSF